MQKVSSEELQAALESRQKDERLSFREKSFCNMDLTGWDLHNIDFTLSEFRDVVLDEVNLQNSSIENALLDGCPMKHVNLRRANMRTASMRYCDMSGCHIEGADLFGAVLEYAVLTGVTSDVETQWFRMHCPETGPILGYKKCFNDRLVQLLIPADAKRTSATLPSCRCNKAKVLTIKSFDASEEYTEAWSLVDENFVYRKGQWVEVPDFNEDRWMDSTTGIHFWMTREEAIGY